MSDVSQFINSPKSRPLRDEERELVRCLLSGVPGLAALEDTLLASRVKDMQDGGMGSIRFVQPDHRSFGRAVAEAQYVDSDGIPVSITINVDEKGELFEVDFWKVDFSTLSRYPKPLDLVVKR